MEISTNEKNCIFCGKAFSPRRSYQRFCSVAHRKQNTLQSARRQRETNHDEFLAWQRCYRARNKERLNEYARRWAAKKAALRTKVEQEQKRERERERYAASRDKENERARRKRQKHRGDERHADARRAYARRWYASHNEEYRARSRLYSQSERGKQMTAIRRLGPAGPALMDLKKAMQEKGWKL